VATYRRNSKKKRNLPRKKPKGQTSVKNEEITYVQNGEQSQSSIWKKIRNNDSFLPKDRVYRYLEAGGGDHLEQLAEENGKQYLIKILQNLQKGVIKVDEVEKNDLQELATLLYDSSKN
jgi:hypothetical protein